MEHVLRELIIKISSLSPPCNPLHLSGLFTDFDTLNLDEGPSSWQEHLFALNNLNTLIRRAFSVARDTQMYSRLIEEHKQSLLNRQTLIHEVNQSLNMSFEILLPLINNTLQNTHLSTEGFSPSISDDTKAVLVQDYRSQLLKIPVALNTFTAQLRLKKLKGQINSQIAELNNLGILCTSSQELDRFQPLLLPVREEVGSRTEIIRVLSEFKNKVEHTPPRLDFSKKIELMIHLQEKNHELHETLETELATHQLEYQLKIRLNDEFTRAPYKLSLIESYQDKIYNYPWINPLVLYSRFRSEQFVLEQNEYKDCVSYLKLLNQKYTLDLADKKLADQKNILTDMITAPYDRSALDIDFKDYVSQIESYFPKANPVEGKMLPTPIADLYLFCLDKIPDLQQTLARKNDSLKKLEALIQTDRELNELRQRFNLLSINDVHLLDDGLLTLRSTQYPLTEEENLTKTRITLCQNYLERDQQHKDLLEKQHLESNKVQELQALIPKDHALTDTLIQMNQAIIHIKTLSLPQTRLVNQHDALTNDAPKAELEKTNSLDEPTLHDLSGSTNKVPHTESSSESEALISATLDKSSLQHDSLDAVNRFTTSTPEESAESLTPIELSSAPPPKDSDSGDELCIITIVPTESAPDSEILSSLHPEERCNQAYPHPVLYMTQSTQTETTINCDTTEHLFNELEPKEQTAHEMPGIAQDRPTELRISLENTDTLATEALSSKKGACGVDIITEKTPLMWHIDTESIKEFPEAGTIESGGTRGHLLDTATQKTPIGVIFQSDAQELEKVFDPISVTEETFLLNPIPSILEDTIELWHQKNTLFLESQPAELGVWYSELYEALKQERLNDPQSHKPIHLIKDILFELQYANRFNVLDAYKQRCPNPSIDIRCLLALKPNVPVCVDTLDDLPELLALEPQLKPLHEQCIKLRKNHSLEANLLLEILHALNEAKAEIGRSGKPLTEEQFPRITDDPRYGSLKRHRGLLRIWEAIEDLFRFIILSIRGLPKQDIVTKPCFFRTRSIHIAEDALHDLSRSPQVLA